MVSGQLEMDFDEMDRQVVKPFEGSTFLVTGATGLVGSVLVRYLLHANETLGAGIHVVACVRNEAKARGILGEGKGLKIVVGDLREGPIDVDGPVDFLLHAAAITKSRTMVERPVDVIQTSLQSTNSMLSLAASKGSTMCYLSSMEMYGTLPEGAVATEDVLGAIDLTSVRSGYPESKRMCELLCLSYASQYGLDVRTARLAQTFGAGVLPGESRVFAQFARSALAGQDIVMHTRGLSEGNYVYTTDALSGILTILSRGKSGEAYNVANESSHMTIREMAELVCETLGGGQSRVVMDIEEGVNHGYAPDVHLKLSSQKLRELGWEPKIGLAEAYRRLGAFLDEQAEG